MYLPGTCIHEKLCTIKLCYKTSVFMYEDKAIFQAQIFVTGFFNSTNVPWEIPKTGRIQAILCCVGLPPLLSLLRPAICPLSGPKVIVPYNKENHFCGFADERHMGLSIYPKNSKDFTFITVHVVQTIFLPSHIESSFFFPRP